MSSDKSVSPLSDPEEMQPQTDAQESNNENPAEFHVVGVGASAGGLEALEALFGSLPRDSGMAFVVVQHLSPDFKSHMEDLLGRRTEMQIHRVTNGMRVEPNSVYLIPPKMEMIISEGQLLLTQKAEERSLSHPIDQFLRSLASDAGRYAVGIILSGTGSDGSRGIRDIHEAGGLTMAQDVQSSKFDGMPMNAQATGCVDLMLPPNGIAEALVRYVKEGLTPDAMVTEDLLTRADDGVDRIFRLLNEQHELDFSHYKATTVGRRIQRRIDMLKLDDLDQYLSLLETSPGELNELYKDLLIGVTKFFRDPDAFQVVEQQVIPKLLSQLRNGDPIRVWVAGCATGEEAYSIAILLDEAAKKHPSRPEIKVFATDAHHVSLHTAARGIYRKDALTEISQQRRERYFREQRDGFHVSRELRRHVVFAPHNVIRDAPFTQMDFVTCRNLLIYLQPAAQKKAISMFHFALKPSGILFLGPSESPGELSDEFSTLDKRWRLYTKRRDVRLPLDSRMPLASNHNPLLRGPITQSTANSPRVDKSLIGTYDRLLDRKMPPSFLVNERFEMLHTFGGAERYLALRSGRPTLNLLELIDESLRTALNGALQHALRKQDVVSYTGLQIRVEDEVQNVRMTVEPILDKVSKVNNLLVEIEPVDPVPVRGQQIDEDVDVSEMTRDRIATLESELRYSQENLQASVEEMETTNEELQATNEELVASNEELQSTNEELHSVNEELYTVNAENQRRMEELVRANEDMDNLLATTHVGVIFLDNDLYIRRFTPEIGRMFHLLPQDIGRSIEGFVHNLDHDNLMEELREVLELQHENELHVTDRAGVPYILRMLPYRSGDEINGVVMTLIDISAYDAVQQDLKKFKFMAESAADGMVLLDSLGQVHYANPALSDSLGYTEDELLQKKIMDFDPLCDLRRYQQLFRDAQQKAIAPLETQHRHQDGSTFPVEVSFSCVDLGGDKFLFGNIRDISERVATNQEMRKLTHAIHSTKNGIIITDPLQEDNPIIYTNPGFLELTHYTAEEVLGRNCRFLQGQETDAGAVSELRQAVSRGDSCRVTLLNYRKDGSTFWNDLQITPVHDEQGELTNFVGVQSEVSKQRRIQQELEEANKRVKQALRQLSSSEQEAQQASIAKSQFLANISHELRTPMTAVLGFADMLLTEIDNDQQRERVETIKQNGEYLLALLNDILDLSKIEAGKLEIASEPVDIQSVISDVKSLMDVRSSSEGIPLSFKYRTSVPREITGDRIRIRQILVNLISNALKFTDEGRVQVFIETDLKRSPAQLEIHVDDTGIGMSEEEIARLFQPFSQADPAIARKFGGSGLGLNISRRLAEGMNASISVTSQKGTGSTFTLSLPISPSQLETLVKPVNQDTDDDGKPDLPSLDAHVLLVDDRREIWRIGKFFLERCGAEVQIAEDGRQAVDAAVDARDAGNPFDLILMDMQMPIMTGSEAVKRLRALGFENPIIALTADAMMGEREKCLDLGCNEFYAKPIDGPELMQVCVDVMSRWRANDGEATAS